MSINAKQKKIVIVVENLPVPADRRVWQEATALQQAGWQVAVICPATAKYPARYEELQGVHIYRHPLPLEAKGVLGFLLEYATALFWELILLWRVWWRHGFAVIQICNPPDLLFIPALPWRLMGTKLVFDHHDICPELFAVKFPGKKWLVQLVTMFEWFTFKLAHLVITTNESFKELAVQRGGKKPADVVPVYSIPSKANFYRVAPNMAMRGDAEIVLGYMGVMGAQDGVENLIAAMQILVQQGRTNIRALLVGDGPERVSLENFAKQLGVAEYITFTGYLTGAELLGAVACFDIGIIPDAPNVYNDKISMNKVFEYTTLGLPVVAFNLTETKRLLGDAAIYAASGTAADFAAAITAMLTNPDRRAAAAATSKTVAEHFDWAIEAKKYVSALGRIIT